MIGIYKITNNENKKIYIGQSVQIEKECLITELNKKEQYYINKYKSFENSKGYNTVVRKEAYNKIEIKICKLLYVPLKYFAIEKDINSMNHLVTNILNQVKPDTKISKNSYKKLLNCTSELGHKKQKNVKIIIKNDIENILYEKAKEQNIKINELIYNILAESKEYKIGMELLNKKGK